MAANGDEREIDTVTLRVAVVVYQLVRGWTPTTRQIADMCSLSNVGAWLMMSRMSDVVPVYLDDDGTWRMAADATAPPAKRHYVPVAD